MKREGEDGGKKGDGEGAEDVGKAKAQIAESKKRLTRIKSAGTDDVTLVRAGGQFKCLPTLPLGNRHPVTWRELTPRRDEHSPREAASTHRVTWRRALACDSASTQLRGTRLMLCTHGFRGNA